MSAISDRSMPISVEIARQLQLLAAWQFERLARGVLRGHRLFAQDHLTACDHLIFHLVGNDRLSCRPFSPGERRQRPWCRPAVLRPAASTRGKPRRIWRRPSKPCRDNPPWTGPDSLSGRDGSARTLSARRRRRASSARIRRPIAMAAPDIAAGRMNDDRQSPVAHLLEYALELADGRRDDLPFSRDPFRTVRLAGDGAADDDHPHVAHPAATAFSTHPCARRRSLRRGRNRRAPDHALRRRRCRPSRAVPRRRRSPDRAPTPHRNRQWPVA